MMRALRIELRRSIALPAGAFIFLVIAVPFYLLPQSWAGRWMTLAILLRAHLFIMLPLAMAAGAWQAWHRVKLHELLATSTRPAGQRVLPTAAAMAIGMVSAYLGIYLACVPRIVPTAGYFNPDVLTVVGVGALSMVAAVWLGMAVGRWLPTAMTLVALFASGPLLMMSLPVLIDEGLLDQRFSALSLLSPAISLGISDSVTVRGQVSMIQALWFAALAATGFRLLAAGDRRAGVMALIPMFVGAAVVAPMVRADWGKPVLALDSAAAAPVCAEGLPRVCVATVHSTLLPEVVGPAREALMLLAKLPDAPTTAMEDTSLATDSPGTPQLPETVLFPIFVDGRGSGLRFRDDLVMQMLDGAGVRVCDGSRDVPGEESEDEAVARRVAAFWLIGEPPRDREAFRQRDDQLVLQTWQVLTALPAQEQRNRVATLRRAALACEGNLLDILTTGKH